jgi:hypothetical protein
MQLHVLLPTCHGGQWLPCIIHLTVQVKEHIILQPTATAPVTAMLMLISNTLSHLCAST